ncbi:MAG: efflux RND transporter periplasmic adaptor subunit [Planctomycetota bacterium]|jgi:RND family efflux transporter MFP subunit
MQKLTIALCALSICTATTAEPLTEGIEAITRPSEDVTPAFITSGLVAKILVKEGEAVKAGQLLIQLDDAAEQARMEQLRAEVDDKIQIEAAQAKLDQSIVDLKKLEGAGSAATEMEVEHARLQVKIEELTVALRKFEQKQKQREYREKEILVDRMRMYSPIDGMVLRIVVDEGEAAESQAKLIRVVKVDPMELDVPVPLAEARTHLKKGQIAKVIFDEPDGKRTTAEGKIDNIDPVADATSDTLNVKVVLPNSTRRPPGEHVRVVFPVLSEAGGKTASR